MAGGCVDAEAAVKVIQQLTGRYAVESLMTFGGEPLLYADVVCMIHIAARDYGIHKRQLITNGFFTQKEAEIEKTVAALCASGVNEILLSVDAFHQEFIPVEPVIQFAEALLKNGFKNLRAHPAWLVSEQHENPYNVETKKLLKLFNDMGIDTSSGNIIFPKGNALKYLHDYLHRPETVDLSAPCGEMPYTGRPDEIDCVSINSHGDVGICSYSIGNVHKNDVLTILDNYNPHKNPATRALLEGGAAALLDYAAGLGITADISDCHTACNVCEKIMTALQAKGVLYHAM
jgi:sulfatase maturation enzyme AslB (radical SAM superfamily)